jgi:hypothetical protein
MDRKLFAGLAVAGALSLVIGAGALAFDDEGEAGDVLTMQAQALTDQTIAGIESCAEAKIAALEAQPAPTGVNREAWNGAVEAATNKVEALAESGEHQAEAAAESLEATIEESDENGVQAPSLDSLKVALLSLYDPANPNAAVCGQINAVTVQQPSPTVTRTDRDNDDEDSDEHESEHHDGAED